MDKQCPQRVKTNRSALDSRGAGILSLTRGQLAHLPQESELSHKPWPRKSHVHLSPPARSKGHLTQAAFAPLASI